MYPVSEAFLTAVKANTRKYFWKRQGGSSAGWGRLKSGIGWISLDFVHKIKELRLVESEFSAGRLFLFR